MRTQTELTFLIGFNELSTRAESFERSIVIAACRLCGGCASVFTDGYWLDDGADHKEYFEGTLQKETCLHIKLSCENDKVNRVYEEMKAAIILAAHEHDIDTDWVHVQRSPFLGMHFSVKGEPLPVSAA